MTRIAVVGSTNLDLVARAERLPRPGETVTGATLERHRGGKGANQALAAARFGAAVRFVAAVGDDADAGFALALLDEAGVDLEGVVTKPGVPTGTALIMVDGAGENQIMVASGANAELRPVDVTTRGHDAVLLQLEIPIETVAAAIADADGVVVLNAAPAVPLPEALLEGVDYVVVNESEHAELASTLAEYHGVVIRTLGAEGAEASRGGEVLHSVPAPSVEAVDTVGAGDAFCGVFTAAVAAGASLERAMRLGSAAGAVAATRPGVQAAIPTRDEVEALLR